MEALVLPGLALTILGFVVYVMVAWLRKPESRALGRFAHDERSRDRPPP